MKYKEHQEKNTWQRRAQQVGSWGSTASDRVKGMMEPGQLSLTLKKKVYSESILRKY